MAATLISSNTTIKILAAIQNSNLATLANAPGAGEYYLVNAYINSVGAVASISVGGLTMASAPIGQTLSITGLVAGEGQAITASFPGSSTVSITGIHFKNSP